MLVHVQKSFFTNIMELSRFPPLTNAHLVYSLIPACSILLILGTISAYTFHLIGRLTSVVNSESDSDNQVTSMGQLWNLEVGSLTSWLVSMAVMLTCFGTSLSYSIILGDTFKSLAQTAGLSGIIATRRFNVAAIALLGVYPLCCLKSLAALAPVSISGVVGIIVTCIVMSIRALPGGAYSTTAAATTTNYLASLLLCPLSRYPRPYHLPLPLVHYPLSIIDDTSSQAT